MEGRDTGTQLEVTAVDWISYEVAGRVDPVSGKFGVNAWAASVVHVLKATTRKRIV